MSSVPREKLPGFGTTIFTVMSALANEVGAINLSQGFPDFEGPQALRDRVRWHMDHGHNQYAPLAGVPELRQAIARKVGDLYGAQIDPDQQIAVTPGATEAISCAIATVVHPGDEVLIVDPAYDSYDPCIRLNGGVPVHVPMTPSFGLDWETLESALSDRTRLLIFNSPHNPTGAIWTEADVTALEALVQGRDLWILSDEVYEHIVFDGRVHHSLLRSKVLAQRAFVVSSFGKTYHATGWRVGYCIASPELMTSFLRIHQFTNFSTNTPLQYALADFMTDCPEHHENLGAFYQPKRDRFLDHLSRTRFRAVPSGGTYFQLADYGGISDRPDTEFARWMTTEHGVAVIPISVFYESPPDATLVRFCFAKDDETLDQAGKRLGAI